jgi:hypothetical protein
MIETAQRRKVSEYFEGSVLPRIAKTFPRVTSEMAVQVDGPVGLGIDDEFSDLEANTYLENQLWETRGWQVQIPPHRSSNSALPSASATLLTNFPPCGEIEPVMIAPFP